MSWKRFLSGLSAALAVSLAACGGDTTGTGDPLSEAEATELAEALVEGGFVGFAQQAAPMGAPGAEAATITVTLNETYPCNDAGGTGTVTMAGSVSVNVNEETGVGAFEFNYTMAPHGCTVPTSGVLVFTVDGDPNIRITGDFDWTETSASGSLNYGGGFAWDASDGRSGTCGVDLTANYNFTWSSTSSSGSATMSGSVCGVTVNRTLTVEA
jgi:hypothetical protein